MKVKCPGGDNCGITWELSSRERKRKRKFFHGEVQHHLYMFHHIEVIESHRMAKEVTEKCYVEDQPTKKT